VSATAGSAGLIAITRTPSPRMDAGERTYVDDAPIDEALALKQHEQYRAALETCGARVLLLPGSSELPDCVFVEDTAIVLDEVAVMMSPGAVSRRGEVPAIEAALREFRYIERVDLPATVDGGDVVRRGRDIFVGLSQRSNRAGLASLTAILSPFGYTVSGVPVLRCLHLKSACSALPDGRFLVNADLIDVSTLGRRDLIPVPAPEPHAGDVLVIGERIIVSDAFPETAELLTSLGWQVIPVSVSEFAKAEGGVTCLSLVFGIDSRMPH
jgi:dimethylargininase